MLSNFDGCIQNLFSLYKFIGNNHNASNLIEKENFDYIRTRDSVWPNVVYGLQNQFLTQKTIEEILLLINNKDIKPIFLIEDVENSNILLRKMGFLPTDYWLGMEYNLTNENFLQRPFLPEGLKFLLAQDNTDLISWTEIVSRELFLRRPLSTELFSSIISQNCECIIMKRDESNIGSAMIYYDEFGSAGLYMVCIDSNHRKQGFGKLLMNFIIERIKSNGVNNIFLQATKMGQPLYASLGFQSGKKYNLFWKIK